MENKLLYLILIFALLAIIHNFAIQTKPECAHEVTERLQEPASLDVDYVVRVCKQCKKVMSRIFVSSEKNLD